MLRQHTRKTTYGRDIRIVGDVLRIEIEVQERDVLWLRAPATIIECMKLYVTDAEDIPYVKARRQVNRIDASEHAVLLTCLFWRPVIHVVLQACRLHEDR